METDDMRELRQKVTDMDTQLHGHIRILGEKVDRQGEIIVEHIRHFAAHEEAEVLRHKQFIESQMLNTKAINDLALSVSGVTEAYKTVRNVRDFAKWVAPLVVAIAAISAYFAANG